MKGFGQDSLRGAHGGVDRCRSFTSKNLLAPQSEARLELLASQAAEQPPDLHLTRIDDCITIHSSSPLSNFLPLAVTRIVISPRPCLMYEAVIRKHCEGLLTMNKLDKHSKRRLNLTAQKWTKVDRSDV